MSDWAPRPIHSIRMEGHIGRVEYGADDRMVVWFFTKPVLMGAKSDEAGRPIYEDRHFVHVQHPGERDCIEREATRLDKERWPAKWQAYVNQQEQEHQGTPLTVLFPSQPALVEMMRPMGVHTVEHLANLTEHAISNLGMGARGYVESAKRFLEESKMAAPFSKMQAELEQERSKVDALTVQLQSALKRIELLEEADDQVIQPRRGRNRS